MEVENLQVSAAREQEGIRGVLAVMTKHLTRRTEEAPECKGNGPSWWEDKGV